MTGSFITDKSNGSLDISLHDNCELIMIANDHHGTVELRFNNLTDMIDFEQMIAQARSKWQRAEMLRNATRDTQVIHLKPSTNE